MAAPTFIDTTPSAAVARAIAKYEELTGKSLYPGQIETPLLHAAAFVETLVRESIQYAATQNLVAYADAEFLDELGANFDTPRLAATPALTTLQFTIAAQPFVVFIPVGFSVANSSGTVNLIFQTTEEIAIGVGEMTATVTATCTQPGTIGNGLLPNSINRPLDTLPSGLEVTVRNTTTTADGSAIENDDAYRARIAEAFERVTVAGSRESYRWRVFAVSPAIIDVAVEGKGLNPEEPSAPPDASFEADAATILATNPGNPTAIFTGLLNLLNNTSHLIPGRVEIFALTADGLPSAELKQAIATALSADTVRPLTDWVTVFDPVARDYEIAANLTTFTGFDSAQVKARVENALLGLTNEIRRKLGRDVSRAEIIATARALPGVFEFDLLAPAQTLIAAPREWATCSAITIAITGSEIG